LHLDTHRGRSQHILRNTRCVYTLDIRPGYLPCCFTGCEPLILKYNTMCIINAEGLSVQSFRQPRSCDACAAGTAPSHRLVRLGYFILGRQGLQLARAGVHTGTDRCDASMPASHPDAAPLLCPGRVADPGPEAASHRPRRLSVKQRRLRGKNGEAAHHGTSGLENPLYA
jgi:hypothetical protein